MTHSQFDGSGMSLFTALGERKYITQTERARFLTSLSVLGDVKDRTFCEMIFWTGCRPSEALALTAQNIDLDERAVVIQSLKKRGGQKGRHFRAIPLPEDFLERLDQAHHIRRRLSAGASMEPSKLWRFSRTTGWRRMGTVMRAAEIAGVRACSRGLRHAYGVHAAIKYVPETRIQSWLGHASLKTTAIYLNAVGPEDRALAERMWEVL